MSALIIIPITVMALAIIFIIDYYLHNKKIK